MTVATGGLGDAFVAPVLIGGISGGGFSEVFYAAACSHSPEGCNAEGAGASLLSGAALGSAGGLIGPLAGATSSLVLDGAMAGLGTRALSALASGGAAYWLDEQEGKNWKESTVDAFIAGGFGLATGDTVENPSSLKSAATQIAGNFGRNGVLVDMASSAIAGISQVLPLFGV